MGTGGGNSARLIQWACTGLFPLLVPPLFPWSRPRQAVATLKPPRNYVPRATDRRREGWFVVAFNKGRPRMSNQNPGQQNQNPGQKPGQQQQGGGQQKPGQQQQGPGQQGR